MSFHHKAVLAVFALVLGPSLALARSVLSEGAPLDQPDRATQLQIEIFEIAQANTFRTDNLDSVHTQLQPLVDELVKLTPARTETEKLSEVVGSWRNVWTDLKFDPSTDLTQIYQVVFADGYYYNISRERAAEGDRTSFLRGAFFDNTDFLNIQFTREFTIQGWLPQGTNLVKIGADAESGSLGGVDVADSRAVGITGQLYNSYVNGDFRIVQGSSSNRPTEKGLYILTRVDTVQ